MPETTLTISARLPAAVFDLALRLGADPETRPSAVNLSQTGRMKAELDATSWMGNGIDCMAARWVTWCAHWRQGARVT